jgi:hypothetical protein
MAKFHRRVASLGPVLIPVNFQGPINSMHQVMPRRESRELSGYNRYGERIVANLELQIPDDVAQILQSEYSDLPRAAVEALALEGYRSKQFSEGLVRQMLGYSSRFRYTHSSRNTGFISTTRWRTWNRIATLLVKLKTRQLGGWLRLAFS